jgi:hypothetical protein
MDRMRRRRMVSLVLLTGIAMGAKAEEPLASISQAEGKVLVSQGEDMVSAYAGMPLRVGDRVFTLEGSRVAVVYPENCVVRLEENSLLSLKSADDCRLGTLALRKVAVYENHPIGRAIGAESTADGAEAGLKGTEVLLGTAGAGAVYGSQRAADGSSESSSH